VCSGRDDEAGTGEPECESAAESQEETGGEGCGSGGDEGQ
jgi:hypothetical protein